MMNRKWNIQQQQQQQKQFNWKNERRPLPCFTFTLIRNLFVCVCFYCLLECLSFSLNWNGNVSLCVCVYRVCAIKASKIRIIVISLNSLVKSVCRSMAANGAHHRKMRMKIDWKLVACKLKLKAPVLSAHFVRTCVCVCELMFKLSRIFLPSFPFEVGLHFFNGRSVGRFVVTLKIDRRWWWWW